MNNIETAHKILAQDLIRNYCAIHLLSLMDNPTVLVEGHNVLAFETSSEGKFALLVPSGAPGNRSIFFKLPENANEFFIIEDWPLEYILPGRNFSRDLGCLQLHLPDEFTLPEDDPRICTIGIEHALYIYENYDSRDFTTENYIRKQIQSGPAIGIFENNRLIAWAMTHEEGSMGFLTVLPQYRRQGLGTKLTTALSRRIRQAGGIPTVHILKTNQASLEMSRKHGFIHNSNIHWLLA